MTFRIEVEREEDGRWIADVTDLPGVLAYGRSEREALNNAKALALRVLANRIEHDEPTPEAVSAMFAVRSVSA